MLYNIRRRFVIIRDVFFWGGRRSNRRISLGKSTEIVQMTKGGSINWFEVNIRRSPRMFMI